MSVAENRAPTFRKPQVSVRFHRQRDHISIAVDGGLDLASAPQLDECLERAVRGDGTVELDLSRVDFVDCAGWRPITAAASSLEEDGRSLRIVALSPAAARLVELIGEQPGIELVPSGLPLD
ncbi:MAG: anti-sigma factor antagonist [Actinobacteria bacterium]|nr:MAG: anti-sigma factor antagonist [Actinomycetota bacterium]